MFRRELLDYIRKDYKELNNLEVVVDGKSMRGSLYNLLTPYLAYTNSLDNYSRVISFYTQEGSKQQKLLPLYIALSNYYKTFTDLKSNYSKEALQTESLEEDLKKLNNSLPETFFYLGKQWQKIFLSFDISRNNKIHFYIKSLERKPRRIAPQIQDILPRLKSYISNYDDYCKRLQNFQTSFDRFVKKNEAFIQFEEISNSTTVGIHEILKLGRNVWQKPKAGVLLFTNKTKYLKLIDDTQFNGKSVSANFPIAEIIINRDGELKVEQRKFSDSSPIIYICSQEYYAGWETIIEELGSEFVNTLIIDDLDEILEKEKGRDYYYFKEFSNSVKVAQNQGRLKDVYFLQKDYKFLHHQFLKTLNLNLYPWLINHLERKSLSRNQNEYSANHSVYSINDDLGAKFWERFKPILLHLRSLIIEENQLDQRVKYLSFLNDGYHLLGRVTSFYNASFKDDFEIFLNKLSADRNLNYSVSFKNKVSFLGELLQYSFSSPKLERVFQIIRFNNHLHKIVIVSKNSFEPDIDYAKRKLSNSVRSKISFIQLENLNPKNLHPFDAVFFLNFSGKLTTSIFLTQYCKNQYLILNNRAEIGFYNKCFKNYTPTVISLSDFSNKLLLLNLEHKEELIEKSTIDFEISDYIIYEESESEALEEKEGFIDENEIEETDGIEEQNFSFILERLVSQTPRKEEDKEYSSLEGDTVLLIFKDTFVKIPSSKYLHILEEDGAEDVKDLKKRACDIEVGDKIFLLQDFNNDFNDLLLYLKDQYPRLNSFYDTGNSWRIDLYNKYVELGGYISRLNKYLHTKGINVTDPTVERWVSGLTIVPECLDQLVDLFSKDHLNQSSKFEKTAILDAANWLGKFRTSLHKEIFLYHIYKKYNMEHQINNLDLKNLISKMDGIVDIKEVLMINQGKNASTTTIPLEF